MSTADKIRRKVSDAYGEAVARAGRGAPSAASTTSSLAGYTRAQKQALPRGAAEASFGCGNPVAFAGVRKGDVVLDLGSGAGLDLLLAARKVGPKGKVIGVDMTSEMLMRARENVAAAKLSKIVELRRGYIEALPVESASVDWVISNCVINLSPEKARVFQEIVRVLKPGGRILISDIVARRLPAWARGSDALLCSCVAGAISERDYVAGLRKAGLTDVEVRGRLEYDAEQIQALAGDVDGGGCCGGGGGGCCGGGGGGCCAGDAEPVLDPKRARSLVGKVASLTFCGRKPA